MATLKRFVGHTKMVNFFTSKIRQKFPAPIVNHVSVSHLAERLNKGDKKIILLDVRDINEYETSHIQNSIRIDPKLNGDEIISILKNEENIDLENLDNDTEIYCYCAIGYRSSVCIKKLYNKNINNNIYNVEGSIISWLNEGNKVINKNGDQVNEIYSPSKTGQAFMDPTKNIKMRYPESSSSSIKDWINFMKVVYRKDS